MENGTFISDGDRINVENALRSAIEEQFQNIELVETRYFRQYGSDTVELLIWKKGGISHSDCEAVHNLVSAELDKYEDAFASAYVLNVSSMGLDRKIVTDDDFRRALDTEIECVSADKKKIHGILEAYDAQSVSIRVGEQLKKIQRNNLTKVQPYVRF